MIEPYQWLIAHANELGYQPQHVGSASVDLELAEVHVMSGTIVTLDNGWILKPQSFYLCSTVEYIKVPHTHAAMLQMRSSPARKGLGHKMAGYIDPGFEGQLTLEIEAALEIEVYHTERLVQLIYIRLTEPTVHPYVGKYKGQVGPTEAYLS